INVTLLTTDEPALPVDPYQALASLIRDGRPLLIGEDSDTVAEEVSPGEWSSVVDAVLVQMDIGAMLLPVNRVVETRRGDKIVSCRADSLCEGHYLLIGRREGSVDLLDTVAERLADSRPDILAANLLVRD